MEPIDTSLYNVERNELGELVRVDGIGGKIPEMEVGYYSSQITYYEQVVENLKAQKLKVEEFERDNPKEE